MMNAGRILIIIALVTVVGCTSKEKEIQRIIDSPLTVESFAQEGVDFKKYSTWNWVPAPQMPMDKNSREAWVDETIKGAFEDFLQGGRLPLAAYE